MSSFVLLGLAILSEVTGTVALRYSDGFSRLAPSLIVVAGYGLSFYLLAQALKQLELGLAYAIWAGVGTALVALIGMAALGEAVSGLKIASLCLVISGVIGLNLSGAH